MFSCWQQVCPCAGLSKPPLAPAPACVSLLMEILPGIRVTICDVMCHFRSSWHRIQDTRDNTRLWWWQTNKDTQVLTCVVSSAAPSSASQNPIEDEKAFPDAFYRRTVHGNWFNVKFWSVLKSRGRNEIKKFKDAFIFSFLNCTSELYSTWR